MAVLGIYRKAGSQICWRIWIFYEPGKIGSVSEAVLLLHASFQVFDTDMSPSLSMSKDAPNHQKKKNTDDTYTESWV